jgi:membrane protease YdiL (CAAX protease family)
VNTDRQALVRFFLLAYGIAWVLWVPLVLSQRGLGLLPLDLPLRALLPGALAPSLAAYFTHRWCYGNWRAVDFIRGWRRAWIGILIAPLLVLVGGVVIPALFLTTTSASDLHWKGLLKYPLWVVHLNILLASPLAEELGWRGYALPKLQCMVGPFRATMVLGLVWALWHLPLFLVKGWTSASVPVFAMIVIGWSTIITFVFNWSGGSVIVAVIAHSAANACSPFLRDMLAGVPTREGVSWELVIALSLLALAAWLTAFTRGRLGQAEAKKGTNDSPDISAQPVP